MSGLSRLGRERNAVLLGGVVALGNGRTGNLTRKESVNHVSNT